MKKKFGGSLDTPIKPRRIALRLLGDYQGEKELRATWQKEDTAKLRLLCKHYGIQEASSMYYELSLALAREFVPGFREVARKGRRSKWTFMHKMYLVVEIERLIRPGSRSHGPTWAAKQLTKREPWKSFVKAKDALHTDGNPAEVLRKIYQDYKNNSFANVMRDAFKNAKSTGAVLDWDRQLAEVFGQVNFKTFAVNK